MLRSGGTAMWRDGRKDEPRTTVSLFRVQFFWYSTSRTVFVSNRTAPGRAPNLAIMPLFKWCLSASVCQVRTGLRPCPKFFFQLTVRSNIMDDVHTH